MAVLVTLLVFLGSESMTRPILGATIPKSVNNAKLELIRQLSKDAGFPQQTDHQEEVCLEEGCLDAGLQMKNVSVYWILTFNVE